MLLIRNFSLPRAYTVARLFLCAMLVIPISATVISVQAQDAIGAVGTQQSLASTVESSSTDSLDPSSRQPVIVGEDGVIRLEATIRGDQQQPRILSIVPWESPAHRRVARVALTGEISETMTPLHRHAFLQRITLHDQLKVAIASAEKQ